MVKRKNIYTHNIDLKELHIKNAIPKDFAIEIEKIPYRGYEVEDISDGRIRKEDYFVFIYNPTEQTL